MKRNVVIVGLLVLGMMSLIGWAVTVNPAVEIQKEVSDAIKTGNVTTLARYFNTTLDISVPGNEGTYSKTQAELILKEFFTKNPPSSFKINHNGSSKDGSVFFIGTYISKQNKNFRTYCLLKKAGDKYLIQQLQFESE
jgi:hypothetical protein